MIDQAQFNMVEQQIRPWEVLDQNLLDTILNTPRATFVPPTYHNLAYADTEIPLNHNQFMMAPKIEARMLQALQLQPGDEVLEIGTGSGYVTALLAQMAKTVYSVDIFPDFIEQAEAKLAVYENVTLEVGDASHGWDHHAPYDAIAVTGSLPTSASAFKSLLKLNGRLFVIEGESPVMSAKLIRRDSMSHWSEECLFETQVNPLVNAEEPARFVF